MHLIRKSQKKEKDGTNAASWCWTKRHTLTRYRVQKRLWWNHKKAWNTDIKRHGCEYKKKTHRQTITLWLKFANNKTEAHFAVDPSDAGSSQRSRQPECTLPCTSYLATNRIWRKQSRSRQKDSIKTGENNLGSPSSRKKAQEGPFLYVKSEPAATRSWIVLHARWKKGAAGGKKRKDHTRTGNIIIYISTVNGQWTIERWKKREKKEEKEKETLGQGWPEKKLSKRSARHWKKRKHK